MIVIVFSLVQMTMAAMVLVPYINQIENMPEVEKKIFSYILFAVGGPLILVTGWVIDILEWCGVVFEDE